MNQEPRRIVLNRAVVTPSIRSGERSFSGEVYCDGELVELALRPSEKATFKHIPSPLSSSPVEMLPGHWLYAGFIFEIFGHDLLEIPSRLWPILAGNGGFEGVVCHRWQSDSSPAQARFNATSRRVFDWFGIPAERVHIIENDPIEVERLTVGEAAFKINDRALPIFKSVMEHVGRQVAARFPSNALFLSRRRLNNASRSPNEAEIEAIAEQEGYVVIHPQAMALDDQIAFMKSAKAVAGVDGSALHLAVFCKPGTKLVCFDTRRHPNQFIIDELFELDAIHVDDANFSATAAREALKL